MSLRYDPPLAEPPPFPWEKIDRRPVRYEFGVSERGVILAGAIGFSLTSWALAIVLIVKVWPS